jgi:hypothetical protein
MNLPKKLETTEKSNITVYTYEEAPKDMELKPEITVWAWRRGR